MYKFFNIILSLCIISSTLFSLPVQTKAAETGTFGENLTWTLENGTLTISGTGDMGDIYHIDSPFKKLNISEIIIENGVTSIGDYVFYDCNTFTSIIIPDSVTYIGTMAFYNCDSLTNIFIPDSVTKIGQDTFSRCYALTSINVSENNNAYSSVDGVLYDKHKTKLICFPRNKQESEFIIPDSTIEIEDDEFSFFDNLASINVSENNSVFSSIDGVLYNKDKTEIIYYPRNKQESEFSIPNSVTKIREAAFENCNTLTNINIPNGVTEIGDFAFSGCDALTSIIIPNGISYIGESVFSSCRALTSIVIPSSIISIRKHAFYDCLALTSIIIPDNVAYIGSSAFYNCKSLTSINIPDSVTQIEDSAFYSCDALTSINVSENNSVYSSIDGVLYTKDKTKLIYYPCNRQNSEFLVPDSVTEIEDFAFYDCNASIKILTPGDITYSEGSAFSDSNTITSIFIPESTTYIGDNEFYGLTTLTDIYYSGTEEQWHNIKFSSDNIIILTDATIHFETAASGLPLSYYTKDKLILTIDKLTAGVWGELVNNDVAPIIRNDRTMLPARFVAENLGAAVEWDGSSRSVIITTDEVEIILTIDSNIAKVNGKDVTLDSPAFIENDRTYTPVRFICENLGATIQWDETYRTVTITK